MIDPTTYGAQCNGITDDSHALTLAVAEAQRTRQALYIPGPCLYTQTIFLTALVPILGDGRSVSRLIYAGPGDAINIRPPPKGADNVGHLIRDIDISPAVPGDGRYAIHVELVEGAHYAYFNFDRISTGDFGARALWLNNAVFNYDGFFNGQISNCFLKNGVLGTRIGDSVQIVDTVVNGRNNVDLSGFRGARMSGIRGGQITTSNGWLVLRNMDTFRMRDVWCESPGESGNGGVDSMIELLDTQDVQMYGLTLSTTLGPKPAHVFGLISAHDTQIEACSLITGGRGADVYGTAATRNTRLRDNNFNGRAAVVVLQGS